MKLMAPVDELLSQLGRGLCRAPLGFSQYFPYDFNHAFERSLPGVLDRDVRANRIAKGDAVGGCLICSVGDHCAKLREKLTVFVPEMFNHWYALMK